MERWIGHLCRVSQQSCPDPLPSGGKKFGHCPSTGWNIGSARASGSDRGDSECQASSGRPPTYGRSLEGGSFFGCSENYGGGGRGGARSGSTVSVGARGDCSGAVGRSGEGGCDSGLGGAGRWVKPTRERQFGDEQVSVGGNSRKYYHGCHGSDRGMD